MNISHFRFVKTEHNKYSHYINLLSFKILFFLLFSVSLNAQKWQPVPMVSQAIKDAGYFGGEGLQFPKAIVVDQQDGSFILYGTDVGGIFRSTNGGEMFEPANVGYNARGNCGFAIDPKNNNRAIAVAGNSGINPQHGLYLTEDKGASWTHVLPFGDYNGFRDIRNQVAFDPSSYDALKGYSTVAYWSKTDENNGGGIFKSTDGGSSWTKISNNYAKSTLKIHPEKGYLYLANGNLYRSKDGGASYDLIESGVVDIDVIMTRPDNIYSVKNDGLYISENSGDSFVKISSTSFPSQSPYALNISHLHPDTIMLANTTGQFAHTRHYSHDGGHSWVKASLDNTLAWGAYNNRPLMYHWDHNDPNVIWSNGGAWITRSIDAGKTFGWYANGLNNVMMGGLFNFNPKYPECIFIGFQDQNAAYSIDTGYTFKYCNVSGLAWGGHNYGSYAASKDLLLTGNAVTNKAVRQLRISKDGGNTWTSPGVENGGIDVIFGDPVDEKVLFFGNKRSADKGVTWKPMTGCLGVCTSNPEGNHELYGVNSNSVVKSFDKGVTWINIANPGSMAKDIAYDHVRNRLYVALSNDGFVMIDCANGKITDLTSLVPKDQYNSPFRPRSVAVDPVNPEVVYAGQNRGSYKTDVSVVRSVDAGKSWEIISRNKRTNNTQFGIPGGQEASALRVHPVTRELWVGTGCYGTWKIGPPDSADTGIIIRITNPENDATLIAPDTVLVKADILINNNLVEKVDLFINDQNSGEVKKEPYEFKWIHPSSGNYEIYAVVTDTSGKTYSSASIEVSIISSALPNVAITSPVNGNIFEYNSNIIITAEAFDTDGHITKVEFFNGTEKLGEDDISPFQFLWEKVTQGTYVLTALATDNSNQTISSESISITVKDQSTNLKVASVDSKYFHVYPNPVEGNYINIQFGITPENGEIRIYDLRGTLVFSEKIKENAIIIPTEIFNQPGLYIIEVNSKRGIERKKLIIR